MAEDLISHYIDKNSFADDTKFGVDQLATLEAAFNKLKEIKLNLQGIGLKDIVATAASAIPEIEKLTSNIAAQTTIVQKATEATRQHASSQNDLTNSSKKLTAEKAKLVQLSSEEAKQIAIVKEQQKQQAKVNKENATETLNLRDAYQKLNKEYVDAAQKAKVLAASEGIHSKAAKEASEQANALAERLKAIDASVGQHTRNVGHYTSVIDELGNGFRRVFERVAEYASVYAIINFFKSTVESALEAEQATARFKATLDNLGRADVFERLEIKAESLTKKFTYLNKHEVIGVFEQLITYGKLTENQINDLLPVITNFAAKQRISIEEATPIIIKALEGQGRGLKQYGINVKDAHSVTERLGIVMEDLGKKVEGAAEAFGSTTQGKIASSKEEFVKLKEEIGTGLLPAFNKLLDGVNGFIKGFSRIESVGQVVSRTFRGLKNLINRDAAQQAIDLMQDEIDRNRVKKGEESHQIEDAAITLVQPEDFNPTGNKILGTGGQDEDKTKAAGEKHLQELKERLNTEFDIYKIAQEHKISLFDKDVNNEKLYYLEQLKALDSYVAASSELIKKQENNDIAAAQSKAQREINRLNEEKKGKTNAEQARINENIKILENNLQQELNLIRVKANDDSVKLAENAADKRKKIIDAELAYEKKAYEDYQKSEQAQIDKDNQRIAEGFKKREQLEKDAAEKRKKIEEDLQQARISLEDKAENLIFTLFTASFDKQTNLLNQQKDDLEKKAARDIDLVNASTRSEQDKAAAILIINAKLQAQKDQIDKQQKENDYKKAKFEQAQQVFDIGIQTIRAVAAIKLQASILAANPLTIALVPLALSQIGFALASGALAIGAILAKPIPHLKHGKNNDYEGPAIVGDGGVPEYIVREDGSIEKTPAHDSLTYLKKSEVVYPNFMDFMKKRAMPTLVNIRDGGNHAERIESALQNQTKILQPLLSKIASKGELKLGASRAGMEALWKWGSRQTRYIHENTDW